MIYANIDGYSPEKNEGHVQIKLNGPKIQILNEIMALIVSVIENSRPELREAILDIIITGVIEALNDSATNEDEITSVKIDYGTLRNALEGLTNDDM